MHSKTGESIIGASEQVSATALSLDIIYTPDALAALTPQWDALCARLPLQTPFSTPTWNILWWQHMHARRLLIHDRLHAIAVRDAGGALIAVAPMLISMRPALGNVGIKVLQFFGADANVTEVRGPICHPGDLDAVLAALQTYLLAHKHLWDWIEWQGLSADQALALAAPGSISPKSRVMCFLPLPADWELLKSRLSRNTKEAIRKCVNSLRREQLAPALAVVGDPGQTRAAIQEFFRLHALRAASKEGEPHANAFRDPKSRAFLIAYTREMARQDKLRIFQLRIDDEVIATRVGFLLDGQLYLYYSGYDPEWGKYSIMTTLVIEVMQWAILRGCAWINLSTGRDKSKLRWQPRELELHNAIQVSPRVRSQLLVRGYRHLRSVPLLQRLSRKK